MTIFPFSRPECALKVDSQKAIITLENIMPTPKAYSTKGSRKMYLSGDSQHFENAVSNMIRVEMIKQGIEQLPVNGGYRLFFMFLFHGAENKPMLKKPDVTNLIKGAEDALVKSGLIADDANVIEIRAEKKTWEGAPGLSIGIDYGPRVFTFCDLIKIPGDGRKISEFVCPMHLPKEKK